MNNHTIVIMAVVTNTLGQRNLKHNEAITSAVRVFLQAMHFVEKD